MKQLLFLVFLKIFCTAAFAQRPGFAIVDRKENKKIDITWNGKLLTAYCYFDSVMKPILFPVNTLDGVTVTRGYPLEPRPGERTDHPHHTGLWLNYESVNGLDFWNNSTAIAPANRGGYGSIQHQQIVEQKTDKNKAVLTATAHWLRPDSTVLLREKTTYTFRVQHNRFIIDRTTTLTARDTTVIFKDVKDGFLAIRVSRELEQPSQQADVFVDSRGNATTVPAINNEGVTGRYYSSNGLQGDAVWSSQGPWTMLQGRKDGKDITIALLDHPSNVGYPTYWHARGYGLFALNPLGRNRFSNGKETLNLTLQPGQSVTFRYRVIVTSGEKITTTEMETLVKAFGKVE